jgi:hypothetical protein
MCRFYDISFSFLALKGCLLYIKCFLKHFCYISDPTKDVEGQTLALSREPMRTPATSPQLKN